MKLLQLDPSDELLKEATLALRARNPKGKVFTPTIDDRLQVITEWNTWWEKNRNRKD